MDKTEQTKVESKSRDTQTDFDVVALLKRDIDTKHSVAKCAVPDDFNKPGVAEANRTRTAQEAEAPKRPKCGNTLPDLVLTSERLPLADITRGLPQHVRPNNAPKERLLTNFEVIK